MPDSTALDSRPALALLLVALGAACSAPEAARPGSSLRLTPPRLPSRSEPAPEAPSLAPPGRALSFEDLFEAALLQSPDLALARARVAVAEAQLAEARAAARPVLGLRASAQRADAPSSYLFKAIDAGRLQPGTDFNDPGAFSNFEAGLDFTVPIWDGGRTSLLREIAEDARDLAGLAGQGVRNTVLAALVDGWYLARTAEEQARTAQASIATVEQVLADARTRFEHGALLEPDVLSLEVRVSESAELLLRAQNSRRLALATLAQLAGFFGDAIELDGEGPRAQDGGLSSLDQALREGEHHRPEIAHALRRVEQAGRGLELAEAAFLPRADLFARGWRNAADLDLGATRDNWALGVTLSFDLLNGRRDAGRASARAELDGARRGLTKARLTVQLEVRAAWLQRENAIERLSLAEAAEHTADRSLGLVRVQYEAGAAPVTRYLEAELMLTEARTRASAARSDLERARASLARALGRFAVPPATDSTPR